MIVSIYIKTMKQALVHQRQLTIMALLTSLVLYKVKDLEVIKDSIVYLPTITFANFKFIYYLSAPRRIDRVLGGSGHIPYNFV